MGSHVKRQCVGFVVDRTRPSPGLPHFSTNKKHTDYKHGIITYNFYAQVLQKREIVQHMLTKMTVHLNLIGVFDIQ